MASQDNLKVIILGAGLAGLAAARILRENHNVTVYERGEPSVATGGQGIMSTPNSIKILDSMGFDAKRAGSCTLAGWNMCDHTGTVQENFGFDFAAYFGAAPRSQMRVDFRDELLRLATAPSAELGIGGDPATMIWNNGAVDLDPEEGVVTLEDGSNVQGDLVVVADGVHSRLRPIIVGSTECGPQKVGLTCYRIALDADTARKALGYVPEWWQPKTLPDGGRGCVYKAEDGSERSVVAYPLRNFDALNMSIIFPTRAETEATTTSWHASGNSRDILGDFADFPAEIRTLIEAGTNVKVWELQELDPLPTFIRGRAILIGDAAHAMTPMQGQGANLSVEDAEAFLLFSAEAGSADVSAILSKIDSVRRPRAARVLDNTRFVSKPDVDKEEMFKRMFDTMTYHGIFAELAKVEKEEKS